MMPRNVTLFRFPASVAPLLGDGLEQSLRERPARECGPLELWTCGFGSALADGGPLAERVGRFVVLRLEGEHKILPAATVNRALAQRVERIATEEGRRVGARERKRLRDEVLTDLMPRALRKPWGLRAFLDPQNGWLAVFTASRRQAELFVSTLREALGTFPAVDAAPENSPSATFAAWLMADNAAPFELGDECALHDPGESGSGWRGTGIALDSDEVRAHLAAGLMPYRLGLSYAGRVHFVLDDRMVLRKVHLGDDVREEMGQGDDELDARAKARNDAALCCLELASVIAALADTFDIPRQQAAA